MPDADNANEPVTEKSASLNPGLKGKDIREAFTLQDGQKGDDDWTVNGDIVDPSGPLMLFKSGRRDIKCADARQIRF